MARVAHSSEDIPRKDLHSWMHERIPVPRETREQIFQRWKYQPDYIRAIDAVMSRLFVWGKLLTPTTRLSTYYFLQKLFRLHLKIHNRLKIFGLQNVPKTGCIFYVNHPGQLDPVILMAAMSPVVGGLVAWGNGWFADMIDRLFGLISPRYLSMQLIVERIVQHFLKKNRYFAIWPEGHPTYKQRIEEGHSSIVRVYSVLNSKKNLIPFVPVLLRGSQCYRIREAEWKAHEKIRKTYPIEIHFFPPIFFERNWLAPPEQGGKTPREFIDYLMYELARYQQQFILDSNHLLEFKRGKHNLMNELASVWGWTQVPDLAKFWENSLPEIFRQLPKIPLEDRVKAFVDKNLNPQGIISDQVQKQLDESFQQTMVIFRKLWPRKMDKGKEKKEQKKNAK